MNTALQARDRVSSLVLCVALHLVAAWALMQLIVPDAHSRAGGREQIISVRWLDLARVAEPPAPDTARLAPAQPRPPVVSRQVLPVVNAPLVPQLASRADAMPLQPAAPAVEQAAAHSEAPASELAAGSVVAPVARPQQAAKESAIPAPLEAARPDYAWNPPPSYPPLLREQGVGGTVWLRVQVLHDGSPGQVELWRSSGYRLLDEAALRAARQWRFKPARRGEQTLASWVEFPVRFTLDG